MAAPPFPQGPARDLLPQRSSPKPLHRAALDQPTPVYGSAQPPHGASGAVRAAAYRIPEHYARHWMLLLLADRIDVLEDRSGAFLARQLESVGLDAAARLARDNPLPLLAAAATALWAGVRLSR